MVQRRRRIEGVMLLEKFEECLLQWKEEEEELDKLTHPQNVPSHYKKYIVGEWKILVQKQN